MSKCPHCDNAERSPAAKVNPIIRLFGIHTHCDTCNTTAVRKWEVKSATFVIFSVLLLQFITSLAVYPALDFLIASQALKITLFMLFHLICLPVYTMTGVLFMVNSKSLG